MRALAIARELDDPDLLADVECTTVRSDLDANRPELAKEHLEARARRWRGCRILPS